MPSWEGVELATGRDADTIKKYNLLVGSSLPKSVHVPREDEVTLLFTILWRTGYLQRTLFDVQACSVPLVLPPPPLWRRPSPPPAMCSQDTPLFSFLSNQTLVIHDCTASARYQPGPSVAHPAQMEELPIFSYTNPVRLEDAEYVFAYCGSHVNLHTQFIARPSSRQNGSQTRHNVIIMALDSTSRMAFHRSFPNLGSFLEDKHLSGSHELLEFSGYNIVGRGTYVNLSAFLTGLPTAPETPRSKRRWMWEEFKEEGYATAFTSDIGYGNINWIPAGKSGPLGPLSELAPYTDEYTYPAENKLLRPMLHPLNPKYSDGTSTRRGRWCFAGREAHEYPLDWLLQFHLSHHKKGIPQFSMSHWNGGHEPSTKILGNYDQHLHSFFKQLDLQGALKNTVVVLVGDHGISRGPHYATDAGQLEYKLPALFMLLPQAFVKEHPVHMRNARANQQSLTTPYDLHRTVMHLLSLPSQPERPPLDRVLQEKNLFDADGKGTNLFPRQPTTPNYSLSFFEMPFTQRTCDAANIPDWWCSCSAWQPLEAGSKRVSRALNFAVDMLNSLTGAGQSVCAYFAAHTILSVEGFIHVIRNVDARKWKPEDAESAQEHVTYRITFTTPHPTATFQVIVREGAGGSHTLLQAMRISAYSGEICDKLTFSEELCMCKHGEK